VTRKLRVTGTGSAAACGRSRGTPGAGRRGQAGAGDRRRLASDNRRRPVTARAGLGATLAFKLGTQAQDQPPPGRWHRDLAAESGATRTARAAALWGKEPDPEAPGNPPPTRSCAVACHLS
jgi:hypothetical protein